MSLHDLSPENAERAHDDAWFATPPAATQRGPCKRHPSTPSSFTCERCGDYRCEDCHRTLGARDLCPPCHALAARDGSASYWSIAAAVLGFWGLGCAPVGWLGALLGVVGLALAIRQGRSAGRMLAGLGIVFGVLGSVIFVLALGLAVAGELDAPSYADDEPADLWQP